MLYRSACFACSLRWLSRRLFYCFRSLPVKARNFGLRLEFKMATWRLEHMRLYLPALDASSRSSANFSLRHAAAETAAGALFCLHAAFYFLTMPIIHVHRQHQHLQSSHSTPCSQYSPQESLQPLAQNFASIGSQSV